MKFGIFLLLLFFAMFGCIAQHENDPAEPNSTEFTEFALVQRVIDGDTLVLQNKERIRLIGINAPEKGEECADVATAMLIELTEGKIVRLEPDVEEFDKYGRLLRYVFVDETFVNFELVKNGLAKAYPYTPDLKYEKLFENAEQDANSKKGCTWKGKFN